MFLWKVNYRVGQKKKTDYFVTNKKDLDEIKEDLNKSEPDQRAQKTIEAGTEYLGEVKIIE